MSKIGPKDIGRMTAKEFQSFVLRDPEQAASVVDSLMNTEVRTTFFSEYLLQRCVRFHVEVATLGFVHEAACQMLEKQLKADPHRDKEKARNALDLKFCSQLIATFYDHHARDGRSLLQSSDIGRQLSLTNQTKRSLELLNRLRNAVEDSKWGSEPALFFKVEKKVVPRGVRGVTQASLAQGVAALTIDALMKGGYKLKEAIGWLDGECKDLGLTDERGELLTGKRIKDWRGHFSRDEGSLVGRWLYRKGLVPYLRLDGEHPAVAKALTVLRSPPSEAKKRHLEKIARSMLERVKLSNYRNLPAKQRG